MAVEITRKQLDAFTAMIDGIGERTRKTLGDYLETLDWSDVTTARQQAVDMVVNCCLASTDVAAQIAATWYDEVRMSQLGSRIGAQPMSGYEPAATEGAIRAIVQKAVDGDPESAVEGILDRASYEINRAAGESMYRNGRRDRARPRYARVPTGSDTCMFCIMLASRGFVYESKEAAGEHYHANCRCRIIPNFDKNGVKAEIEGYDPSYYYDVWKNPDAHPEFFGASEESTPAKKRLSLIDFDFMPASDRDQAAEFMARFIVPEGSYKRKVDFGAIDIEYANGFNKAVSAVYDAYDVRPIRSFQRFNLRESRFKGSTAEASIDYLQGDFYYNQGYFKSKKALAGHVSEFDELMSIVMDDKALDSMIARYGSDDRKRRYAQGLKDSRRPIYALGADNYSEIIAAHEMGHWLDSQIFRHAKDFDRKASMEQYASGISAYATTEPREYIAESFAAYYAGDVDILDPKLVEMFDQHRRTQ